MPSVKVKTDHFCGLMVHINDAYFLFLWIDQFGFSIIFPYSVVFNLIYLVQQLLLTNCVGYIFAGSFKGGGNQCILAGQDSVLSTFHGSYHTG